ncbi:NUDIX hydrolase [Specibacter sp. AOP5-B1-6]|uniref:NUDIX hydrolase n=1 Tax=Specibacter sp. AOP5-B1-6 TaxID=3457653 RepID=UPI00402B39F2
MTSIRNLSVGLPIRNGHLLAEEGYDTVKGTRYLRAIGGGIEFGEAAEVALRREFREELGVELGGVQLLGVVENIFEYEGAPGHQIAHIFGVESPDLDSIALDTQLYVLDEGSSVSWFSIARLKRPLYPEGAAALMHTWTRKSRNSDVRTDSFRDVPLSVPLTGRTNIPKPASQSLAANNDQAIVW